MCQNCKLCKNNVVIESEIESKIKRALAYNITKEYKDESKKNKAPAKVTTTIESLQRVIDDESKNTNDRTHNDPVTSTMLKAANTTIGNAVFLSLSKCNPKIFKNQRK